MISLDPLTDTGPETLPDGFDTTFQETRTRLQLKCHPVEEISVDSVSSFVEGLLFGFEGTVPTDLPSAKPDLNFPKVERIGNW